MLTSIRTVFSKGIARYILIFLVGLLVFSFGLWGIQDIFKGFRSTEVARIGDSVISLETFQRQYNQQVQRFSRQIGQPLTAEQARTFGVDKQLLGRLITDAALDERAKGYGLGLPIDKMATMVMADPNFQAGTGRFDRNYFNAILRENGLSEAGFFQRQRLAYKRAQIGEAIAGEAAVPAVMKEALTRFNTETRGIAYMTLTDAAIGEIAAPDADALARFFEERKADFVAPEYRKFTYMVLTPESIAAKATVTDDDAKADYDARKDRFTTPEKRTVEQIAFPTVDEAKAAADRLASGAVTFDALVTERNLKPADVALGSVTKNEMLDPVIADAAFAQAPDTVSGVIGGKLTTVILRVTKVEPTVVVPFETAKDQIKKDMALDRARKDILDVQGKIEDARAGGATLKEVGPKFGLEAIEVAASDKDGLDPEERPLTLPQQAVLLRAVFTTETGVETDVIDAHEAGFVWYSVDGVTPSRDRTLDEAKVKATAAWTAAERVRRLKTRADELVTAIKGGKSLEDVAKEAGLEVKEAWNLKRNEASQGLSTDAITTVFATVKGAVGTTLNGNDRIVFRMNESTVPEFSTSAPAAVALDKQLSSQIGQDILNQYVLRSQTDLGLVINQTLVNQATGGGS